MTRLVNRRTGFLFHLTQHLTYIKSAFDRLIKLYILLFCFIRIGNSKKYA